MTPSEAAGRAGKAFQSYRGCPADAKAVFLETFAAEIEALGDPLLEVCRRETALPLARLSSERARTCGQLRLFAATVREGSWVDARIDTALPDRKPVPRLDLRRMLVALGPVAVFGSSNFPLAFSVAGGDTASALAAGCPVVVKAHSGHPETSRLVAGAAGRAVKARGLPEGVFSMVEGRREVGIDLVRQPEIAAVGFTGSHTAGRALFDAATARPRPIPVFSEMSSVNPMLILPAALRQRTAAIAEGFFASFTLGVGQFCTKPGLVFVRRGEFADAFLRRLSELVRSAPKGAMLTPNIRSQFEEGRREARAAKGVHGAGAETAEGAEGVAASFASTTAASFLSNSVLSREVFGPFALVILCDSDEELSDCLNSLDGQLTATVHAEADDLPAVRSWLPLLERKVGRVVMNGFPTGVEVGPAMNHGGPYPATTDSRFTSVGTAAILRFARPVCFQNLAPALLPPALQNANPLGILRMVDGAYTREPLPA